MEIDKHAETWEHHFENYKITTQNREKYEKSGGKSFSKQIEMDIFRTLPKGYEKIFKKQEVKKKKQ